MFLLAIRRSRLQWVIAFSSVAPFLCQAHTTLISPNGGEQLVAGDTFSIEWTVAVPHNLENWDLWYSTTSADGPWVDIAMDLTAGDPNVGSQHLFDWLVPALDSPDTWVRVRMDNMGMDYYDVSATPVFHLDLNTDL